MGLRKKKIVKSSLFGVNSDIYRLLHVSLDFKLIIFANLQNAAEDFKVIFFCEAEIKSTKQNCLT